MVSGITFLPPPSASPMTCMSLSAALSPAGKLGVRLSDQCLATVRNLSPTFSPPPGHARCSLPCPSYGAPRVKPCFRFFLRALGHALHPVTTTVISPPSPVLCIAAAIPYSRQSV
jgi:hypothetical protein